MNSPNQPLEAENFYSSQHTPLEWVLHEPVAIFSRHEKPTCIGIGRLSKLDRETFIAAATKYGDERVRAELEGLKDEAQELVRDADTENKPSINQVIPRISQRLAQLTQGTNHNG